MRQQKMIDLTGHVFNKLTVIQPPIRRGRSTLDLCRCDCGVEKLVYRDFLTRGKAKSCGCMRRVCGPDNCSYKGVGELSKSRWKRIRQNAEMRNWPFEITIEYAWDLFLKQGGKCNLTGEDIEFSKSSKKNGSASLDRINSTKGYIEGNVQWLHTDVNRMKTDLPEETLTYYCRKILELKGYMVI